MNRRRWSVALATTLLLGCGARSASPPAAGAPEGAAAVDSVVDPSGGPEGVEAFWRPSLGEIEGGVELEVRERVRPRGRPPTLELAVATVHEYGCAGHRVETELSRGGDSLRLELLGVSTGGGLCAPMMAPAEGAVELDLTPGRYALTVALEGAEDRYRLVLTEAAVRLHPLRSTFSSADTRLRLRRPRRSFALYCGTTAERAPLCGRLRSWVASREGVTVHEFRPDGVVPYRRGTGFRHDEQAHFRYRVAAALEPVRSCLARLDAALRGLSGTRVAVELWTGELVEARGRDRGPREDGDLEPPAGAAPCLPAVPPPSADSLSIDRAGRGRYLAGAREALPCELLRQRAGRRDGPGKSGRRRRIVRDGDTTVVYAPGPVAAPSPREEGGEEAAGRGVIPPNTSRTALDRRRLHRRLRDWLCRGGREPDDAATVGDAARHPGAAWLWVEEGGDWHFLRPGATAAGVEAYLELVDARGGDVAWHAEPRTGGPERVRFGPDRVHIPGFPLYRWRP